MTELPKTFEELGIEMPDLTAIPEEFRPRIEAEIKLMYLAKHLNEDWRPNANEWAYFPWFYINLVGGNAAYGARAGFGGVSPYGGASYTLTHFGSRLCFKTRTLAEYAGRTFTALYEQYLLS
jgi:hypothetical protein